VAFLEDHDQIGNRAAGDRMSCYLDAGSLACGAAVLLTSPWTPMLFMGEEWGASTPWQFFTDHTDRAVAEMVRAGRRAEFADHGWDVDVVPDPQDPATFRRSVLDWDELGREPHQRLLRWYSDLLRLRRQRADLRDPHLDQVEATWDPAERRFRMRRGAHEVLVNLSDADLVFDVVGRVVLSWDPAVAVRDGRITLPPRSAAVLAP
jgi:maltooligosyltrehalose trehalohydrolase